MSKDLEKLMKKMQDKKAKPKEVEPEPEPIPEIEPKKPEPIPAPEPKKATEKTENVAEQELMLLHDNAIWRREIIIRLSEINKTLEVLSLALGKNLGIDDE